MAASLFPDIAPRRTIGRFELLGLLGSGGMGSVYRAYDPQLERPVAIKLAHRPPHAGGAPSSEEAEALREARAMARLSHPNVVAVHEVCTEGSLIFVVMELVEGESLDRWLRERPRSVAQILEVFRAAARGLLAVHALGVVHRDFKGSNVLIGAQGGVKVADFGLALSHADSSQAPNPAGTPRYMAPEQLRGSVADARSDQFSLCAALYEALNDAVFGPHARRWAKTGPAGDRIPRHVRAAVERGLAPEPEDRWESMAGLEQRLGPRRRSHLGALLAVAATAAAVTITAMPREDPCEASVLRPETSLDELHIDGVAEDRSRLIIDRLGHWASSWDDAISSACGMTPVAERRQRLHCLETLTYDFDAVARNVETLATEGEGDIAADLPAQADIDGCLHGEATNLATRWPTDAVVAGSVRDLRKQLAEVRRMSAAPAERTARYEALVSEALALGFSPLEREVHRAFAGWHDANGSAHAALESFERAYHAALSSNDHERAAYDAMEGARLSTVLRRDEAVTEMWLTQAQTHVDRLPPQAPCRIALVRSRGVVALSRNDLQGAVVEFETAYNLAVGNPHAGSIETNALQGLAEAYSRLEEHGLATEVADLSLSRLEIGVDTPPGALVSAHLNASSTHGRAGELSEAGEHLTRALERAEGGLSPRSQLRAMLELNLGAFEMPSDPRRAAAHLGRAQTILRELLPPEHPLLARAEFELGQALFAANEFGDALVHMELAGALPPPFAEAVGLDGWLLELRVLQSGRGRRSMSPEQKI